MEQVWDKVWGKDHYSSPQLREEKANKKLDIMYSNVIIRKSDIVVDIGCGGGYLSKQIYSQNQCSVTGVDFSVEAIEIAKNNCYGLPIKFLNNSVEKMELPDEYADVVVCFGCLEHVANINHALQEIKRILKNKGTLFITSSNKKSFMYHHRKIKEFLKIWKYGYQKNWKPLELTCYIEQFGFTTINCDVHLGIGDFKYITLLDSILRLFDKYWGRYIIYTGSKR